MSLDQITSLDPFKTNVKETQSKLKSAEKDYLAAKEAKNYLTGEEKKADVESKQALEKGTTQALEKYKSDIENDPIRQQIRNVSEEITKMGDAYVPRKDNIQDLANLFSLVNIAGFALGSGGKKNSIAAMSAMNGMMEGHRAGREDLYKKEKEEFEFRLKKLKQTYEMLHKGLAEAMPIYAVNKELGIQKAREEALKVNADFFIKNMDKFGLANSYENFKAAYNDANKAFSTAEKELRNAEAKRLARQEDRDDRKKEKQEDKKEKNADRKITIPMIQGIRSIENLQNQLNDPEVQKGLKAKAAPLLEKIKSFNSNTDFEQAVNRSLTGTDKTTVFLKDALLAAYEIEKAAKGGRPTVYDMKTVSPVLDPTNYTPQAYNEILESRRKTLYENLQDYGYKLNQIKEATAPRAYTPYGGSAAAPESSIKSYASEAEAEAAFKSGKLKSGEKVIIGGERGTWE